MKRVFSAIGTLMVVAGAGLLTYVLIQYHNQSSPSAKSPHWSAAQAKKGKEIAAQFAKHQTVKVPVLNKRVDAGREPAIRMIVPRIGLDVPVVQTAPVNGVWDVADWKVGHLSTTPNPGAPGNAAFSAHDDIKGEIFKRVNELTPGSQIILTTRHASFTYVVTGQQVVDPSNTAPLNPTKASTITLISCTPYWVDTQRLIVKAVLKSSSAT